MIRTTTYVSKNEHNWREVEFELERTFLDKLLRRPAELATFYQPDFSNLWYEKATGQYASTEWIIKCDRVVDDAAKSWDFGGTKIH